TVTDRGGRRVHASGAVGLRGPQARRRPHARVGFRQPNDVHRVNRTGMIDPLRTLLFIPGHREAWIERACGSGTDAILFDLQDAVPPDRLDDARSVVAAAVA